MFKVNLEVLRDEMQGDLNRCNIHLLREQGAKLGVPSVTTHKKSELINLIIEKKLSSHRSYEVDKFPEYSSEVSIADKEALMEKFRQNDLADGEFVSGIIELHHDVDGFLRVNSHNLSKDDVFIPQGIINEYKLKYGDSVVGKAIPLDSQNFQGLYNIISVNGHKSRGMIRRDFVEIPANYADAKIKLPDSGGEILQLMNIFSPIAKGQRNIIFSEGLFNATEMLCNIVKALNANNIKTVGLFLSENPENISYVKNVLGDNAVTTGADSSIKDNERIAQFTVERLKRDAEIGKSTAIVLNNVASLYGDNTRSVLGKPFNFKTLYGTGRQLENGGSLTIVAFAYLTGNIGENIYETLAPLSNSISFLVSDEFSSDMPTYDVYQSFSDYFTHNNSEKSLLEEVKKYIRENDDATQAEILKFYRKIK